MASKKGIALTVMILAVITGASFLFWTIPQENESTFVVSDYGNYLDGIKNIHEILQKSMDIEFQNLLEGEISSDEYIEIADVTNTQVTAKISEFVTSKPSEPWQESYISYMDALKKFNSYIVETKIYANMIKEEKEQKELDNILEKIENLKSESKKLAQKSDDLRP